MSDATAFLSGCAITGVAAVLVMGGGLAIGQYKTPEPVLPAIPVQTAPPPSVNALDSQDQVRLNGQLDRQQTEIEGLKTQVSDLKSQLEKQQTDTQRLNTQIQQQQTQLDTMTLQRARPADVAIEQPNRFQALTLGAMGAVMLIVVVGGGMVLVGVIVLIVSQRRQSRSMQVIHPIQPPYSFSTQEFLPPSPRPRRTRQIEYYED